jgi:UV DNA damage endonuclease
MTPPMPPSVLRPPPLYRLGVPVKVLGAPLRSHDSRRWQNQPHLSVSLAYLRDLFDYLHTQGIHFYRLAGQLAPYLTHPALPAFHRQIEECSNELAAIGDLARHYRLRLTMHLAHFIQLSSPDPERVQRSQQELAVATRLLDAMGLGPEAVIVVHVGGVYGDSVASRERFVRSFAQMPASVQARLALENDDRHFSLADALWLHRHTGIRVVLDTLHQRCLNPTGHPPTNALALALATWPADEQPKIHVSSPRTALRQVYRNGQTYLQAPLPNQHSDFIDVFQFIDLLRSARAANLRPFDIMLEAKAKDLALLRLREQIVKFAPDLAGYIG